MPVSVDLNNRLNASLRATRWSPRQIDIAIAVAILCAGTLVGDRAVLAFRAAGEPQYFYQSDFGPAVMVACGGPFREPDTRHAPALAAFLAQAADAIDCGAVPTDTPLGAPNPFQQSIRYLEYAVALTWKLTGISWSRLALLPGVLFGAVAALTYGILRLALSRPLALAALMPSVTSTPNFMQVPQLRDYAKGPFLLAIILIMGVIVVGPTDRRQAIAWSAVAGAVVGIGLGFRTDLLIAIVPFVVAVAFLLPAAVSAGARIGAILVFLAAFGVAAFPLLRDQTRGGNNAHVVLLGLFSDFDGPLRVQAAPYEYGGRYVDSLAATIINSYAIRVDGRARPLDAMTADYDRAGGAYLAQIAAAFPADVVTRVVAAVRTASKYFLDSSLYPPVQLRSERLRGLYPLRARILWRLGTIAFVSLVASTLLVAAVSPRAACLMVLVAAGIGGASAVQFHERHFYYLQFVPWFAFGLLAQAILDAPSLVRETGLPQILRAVAFLAIAGGGLGVCLTLSRAYQQRSAARLFERYAAAPREPLATEGRPAAANRTLITTPEWLRPLPHGRPAIGVQMYAVRFHDDQCGAASIPLTLRYDGRRNDADLSETIAVPLRAAAAAPTTTFVAAYDWSDEYIRFRGLEVSNADARCVADIARVGGVERIPLLLTTTLSAGWRQEALYQRLR
jgi:hypothetical protein